jgi:hypothetical protein
LGRYVDWFHPALRRSRPQHGLMAHVHPTLRRSDAVRTSVGGSWLIAAHILERQDDN